jgi:phosphoserine aminotransferase
VKRFILILAILGLLVPGISYAWPTWTGTSVFVVATDNNTSTGVSIPRGIKRVGVIVPTITTGTLALHVSNDGVTYYAYQYITGASTPPVAFVTTSGTHNIAMDLPSGVTAFKYLRFEASAQQTANVTITVFGQE